MYKKGLRVLIRKQLNQVPPVLTRISIVDFYIVAYPAYIFLVVKREILFSAENAGSIACEIHRNVSKSVFFLQILLILSKLFFLLCDICLKSKA